MKLKLIILLLLTLSLTITSVTGVTTGKIYFKDSNEAVTKKIGNDNIISVYFWNKNNQMNIMIHDKKSVDSHDYQLTGATIVFKKKIGKKTLYSTKKFTTKTGIINYAPKNGYKPYYAVVSYKKLYC